MKISIVGGGVFGLAAAWRLAVRGHEVEVLEADLIPASKAASRDISKAFRGGYGASTARYAPDVARARELWRDLESTTGRSVYHETGCLQICTRFDPGDFEREGFEALDQMGWPVAWLGLDELAERYPAFRLHGVVGGVLDSWGGWVDPMEALPALAEATELRGGRVRTSCAVTDLGDVSGDVVLVCAGAIRPGADDEAARGLLSSGRDRRVRHPACVVARHGYGGLVRVPGEPGWSGQGRPPRTGCGRRSR